ncbi:glutathione S-transferase family protein [Gilvimarinus algae]|uniref:Glutathione S-transferase family protein n=1 Tax=Gilvimarinus algae TaxID=3058037 RepID=A0ABT8T9X9_9GAMM|nr:glutathione S-transferase family protein [Gilvimarinus sp. SDUM040014]MDO3380912.1 glutathione S-transferase family protein [Gilvimarinus sp. SDUM040014]
MYKLYSYPFSQYSRRAVSLMEQVGIEYENHLINLKEKEQMSEKYIAINPNHQVPTLLDGDIKIHESNAILRYLCVKHELFDWYPRDYAALAKVEQWLDWTQCQLCPLVETIVVNRILLGEDGDINAASEEEAKLVSRFEVLEDNLKGQKFLVNENPTIADLSLASSIFQLKFASVTLESSLIIRWYESVEMLPGFQKSLPKEQ